jgi:hypothetical protein
MAASALMQSGLLQGGLVAPSDEPYQGGYQQENVQNDNTAL